MIELIIVLATGYVGYCLSQAKCPYCDNTIDLSEPFLHGTPRAQKKEKR